MKKSHELELGIDASSYFETLGCGAKYYDGSKELKDPLAEFVKNGVKYMRVRVWVDPHSESGEPYLGGTCDLDNFIKLAKLSASKGYRIMIDLHYSDFWVDPSKQTIPKAWPERDLESLAARVYSYTAETLDKIKAEGIELDGIQVGNEITNGFLWPVGKLGFEPFGERSNYGALTTLLSAGIKACRERYKNAEIMIHLERSYDKAAYGEYFDRLTEAGVDFDIIAMSYYQFWHGSFTSFFENVDFIKKYGKKIMVVETGYPFTFDDYEKDADGNNRLMINDYESLSTNYSAAYPFTPAGQAQYIDEFLTEARAHGIACVFWWEPLWVPAKNTCWASEAGEAYLNELGKPTRNEWSNQCLFDYEGKKLPAFNKFKK